MSIETYRSAEVLAVKDINSYSLGQKPLSDDADFKSGNCCLLGRERGRRTRQINF